MPAGKRQQNNAMLYTLIIFVALFIIATTVAVIYYVKSEEHRTNAADLQRQKDELASSKEWAARGAIVGPKQRQETYLGKMVDYLDEMVYLITGGPSEETSAEVKVNTADRKVKETLELLAQEHVDIETIDPNTTGLIRIMEKLKTKLDETTSATAAWKEQYNDLQKQSEDADKVNFEKEQRLLAEKEKYQQQVNKIKQDYKNLEDFLKLTTGQQVQILRTQLKGQEDRYEKEHDELLKTQAQLKMVEDRTEYLRQQIEDIMPSPDPNAPAYKPDGKIILVGDQIVHLNIGSNDHVYQGLTFTVYDKGMPIPKDGKGKAEIEVFDVAKTFSAARIIPSKTNKPIIQDDIIANLIWDSDKRNVFVVAGEFDLDGDGNIDYDAVNKIKARIENWGGRATDTVSINTDFLVLGRIPKVRKRPTLDELEIDPLAMEKYNASLEKLAHYKQVQSQARALSIPIFNYERFLYFIGYKSQAPRAGAF